MLTHWRRAVAAAVLLVAVTLVPAPALAQTSGGDPDHPCAVAPDTVHCKDWLADNRAVDDPSDPVCLHLGAFVPCRSPLRFGEHRGWWVGDVSPGHFGWSYLHRGDPERIDGNENKDLTVGCWGWQSRRTGEGTDTPSPGSDPDEPGAWYMLLCLGERQWSTGIDLTRLPGYYREVEAWRRTGAPAGDPVRAALNALATLDIAEPTIVTAPPSSGSVPLGMPVWLAVDDTDPNGWGPLTATGCDGSLCVNIRTWLHELEWQLGDGQTLVCSRDQNVRWQPGMNYLEPAGVCHHYYHHPSRDLAHGRYPVEVVAHWRTTWSAPTLGESGVLEHTRPPVATSVRVVEVQVLVTR